MGEQVNKNVPAIRFKGFSDDWQQQKIGDVVEEKKRPIVLNDHQSYELITVKRRNGGVVSRGYLLGKEILVKNYYQLQENDFVISKRQVVHGATGIIPKELDKAIVSNEYLVAVSNDRLTTEFLNLLSCQPKLKKDFFLSSYGVDIEKLFFDTDDWKKRSVSAPTKTEQQQINGFFKQLDAQLILHQTKLDKLNTLKQAMLQKMFPQGNATEPEIRFKGFNGDWKTDKFGNLVLIQRGGSPRPIEAFITQDDDGINWVKIGDVSSSSRYINKTKEKIRPEGASSSRWVYKGDLILSNSMSFGRPYIMNIDGCIHDGWLLIRNEKNIFDLEFLLQLLSSEMMLSQYRELASGGVVNNLNSALVQSTTIVYPEKEEQQKIGAYFRKLDGLIALERTQLEKLKQIKQACLAGMFV